MVTQINSTAHAIKGMMHGTYYVDSSDTLHVTLKDSKRPKTIFKGVLKLSCAKQGRHNKLTWGNENDSCITINDKSNTTRKLNLSRVIFLCLV